MQHEQKTDVVSIGVSAMGSYYQAVAIQIGGDGISILKNDRISKDEIEWRSFLEKIRQDFPGRSVIITLAFNDHCVGFYRFEVPAVNERQMTAIISSQAEVHLPLPIEQMLYDWRPVDQKNGKTIVTVAAAKRDMLSDILAQARQGQVDAIVLGSEAILKAVTSLSDITQKDFGLLYFCDDRANLIFVQNGMLVKTSTFDCDPATVTDASVSEISLLCLDIQNVLAEYTASKNTPFPVFLGGDEVFTEAVEAFLSRDIGIEVRPILYDFSRISGDADSEIDITCAGSALMAYETGQRYHLFDGVYHKVDPETKETPRGKKRLLAAAVCLAMVVFIAVSYATDKIRLAVYEKQMDTVEFKQLLETHHLRSTVARERIDIPDLIEKINQSVPEGVSIHSLSWRRFQRISIGGSCKEPKKMYDFAEAIAQTRGIGSPRISNQDFDEKKRQTTFTLTFDYKNFTDKRKNYK